MYTEEAVDRIREAALSAAWSYLIVIGGLFVLLVVIPAIWRLIKEK